MSSPRVGWPWRDNVVVYLAFVAASMYGLWVARSDGPVAIAWPASAVGLTAVVLAGHRILPAIALGAITAALLDGLHPAGVVLFAGPTLLEVSIATALFVRAGVNPRFADVSDSLNLAWIAGVASVAGGVTGAALLVGTGVVPASDYLRAAASWILGDAVGILAFAPAFLMWSRPDLRVMRPARAELALMVAMAAVVSLFVLVQYTVGWTSRSVTILLALFPLLIWISLRADLPVAAALVVLLSVAATLGVKLGTGALTSTSVTRGIINVQMLHVLSVLLVLVCAASVTAREKALAMALESERKLSLVFEGTSDVHTLYQLDAQGTPRVLIGNQGYYRGLQLYRPTLDPAAVIGKTMDEIGELMGIGPEERGRHVQPMQEAITTGRPVQYEIELPTPIGPRFVETFLTPLGGVVRPGGYVLATARDVTDRRQAAMRLRESEIRFAAVADATNDVQALFARQPDGDFALTYLNRAGHELLARLCEGHDVPPVVGQTLERLLGSRRGLTEVQARRNLMLLQEAVDSGEVVRFEDTMQLGERLRISEVAMIPIRDGAGRVTHVLRSSIDITDRKLAEAERQRSSDDLERRVAERTAQLAMANRELEAFSYSLSHDLRAPLRSIEGFSRALLEDHEPDLPPRAVDYTRRILGATGRMKQLLEDLLRLSQLPTANLDRELIDLSGLVHNVLAELRAADGQRHVEVQVQDGMQAHGDARLLAIAVQNLLGNAWKYTSRRPNARIEVGQSSGDGSRVTFVRDNGAGFDPRFAEHLFAPFQRLHRAEEFEGAGIGLATVRRIVAAHGGRVWADGRPGQGATFWFTLGNADNGHT